MVKTSAEKLSPASIPSSPFDLLDSWARGEINEEDLDRCPRGVRRYEASSKGNIKIGPRNDSENGRKVGNV